VSETPVFRAAEETAIRRKVPIVEVFQSYWRGVAFGTFVRVFFDVMGYTVLTFGVFYVTQELGLMPWVGTTGVALTAAVSIVVVLIAGRLADRVGWRPILLWSAVLGILFIFPFFALLESRDIVLIWIAFIVLYGICNQAPNAVMGTFFATLFPTRMRYTGVGVTYNLEGMIGGGPAPFIATALFAVGGGQPWVLAWYMVGLGLVSLILTLVARETLRRDITSEDLDPRVGRRLDPVVADPSQA
jgi:MFS family permease